MEEREGIRGRDDVTKKSDIFLKANLGRFYTKNKFKEERKNERVKEKGLERVRKTWN